MSECQNPINLALTDPAQIQEAITALREYPVRYGVSYRPDTGDWNDPDTWSSLANALQLSLDFKVGHVLNARGASLIQQAIAEKKRLDEYYASDEYKERQYKEAHPIYTRLDGSTFDATGVECSGSWGFSGGSHGVTFKDGDTHIYFKYISPGFYHEMPPAKEEKKKSKLDFSKWL